MGDERLFQKLVAAGSDASIRNQAGAQPDLNAAANISLPTASAAVVVSVASVASATSQPPVSDSFIWFMRSHKHIVAHDTHEHTCSTLLYMSTTWLWQARYVLTHTHALLAVVSCAMLIIMLQKHHRPLISYLFLFLAPAKRRCARGICGAAAGRRCGRRSRCPKSYSSCLKTNIEDHIDWYV